MVVLIHRGCPDYLHYSLIQASRDNCVILLGDTDPNISSSKIKFVNFSEYMSGVKEFDHEYVHMSTNFHEFELFCFSRWFILRNFMNHNKIDNVFYIDSDVMLYQDMEKEWDKFSSYTMTLIHRTAAISSFFTRQAINKFCDFLMNTYSNKNSYDFNKLVSKFTLMRSMNLHGGVCDMTLFDMFHYDSGAGGGPGRVGEMMSIIDKTTYDHNINAEDHDFEMMSGVKKVLLFDRYPHVWNSRLEEMIQFNSLHFQGSSKQYMEKAYVP